jgi:hypothetical protein
MLLPQGLGEGVALPSMNNLVAAHIPPNAKSRALGMAFSGFHSGGGGHKHVRQGKQLQPHILPAGCLFLCMMMYMFAGMYRTNVTSTPRTAARLIHAGTLLL